MVINHKITFFPQRKRIKEGNNIDYIVFIFLLNLLLLKVYLLLKDMDHKAWVEKIKKLYKKKKIIDIIKR